MSPSDLSEDQIKILLRRQDRLRKEYESYHGSKVLSELHSIDIMVDATLTNAEKLGELVSKYRESDEPYHGEYADKGHEFQREYARLFHNYATSTYSLYNHTQRFINKFARGTIADEYSSKIGDLDIGAKFEFIKNLRHYTQKRSLPALKRRRVHAGDEDEFRTVILSRDNLLNWNGWNKEAEQYLHSLPKRIDVPSEVRSYSKMISDFYSWFDEIVRNEYEHEFTVSEEMLSDIAGPLEVFYSSDW